MTRDTHDTVTDRGRDRPTEAHTSLPTITGEERDLNVDIVYALSKGDQRHGCAIESCRKWATHYIYRRTPHLSAFRCPSHLQHGLDDGGDGSSE